MSRPKIPVPLVEKIAQAFKAVGKLPRRGTNKARHYPFTRATDVLESVRLELFNRGVLVCPNESSPEYVPVGPTNGGEQMTECRLAVTYTFRDVLEKLEPMVCHGVGRDVDDKALYKAQTGAQKALLKRFGLMAEDVDDPEFDGEEGELEPDDAEAATRTQRRVPKGSRPLADYEVANFNEACKLTGKTAEEVASFLATHNVTRIEDLWRKYFKPAIRWASNGAGTLAPKPQAVPGQQQSLALRTAPQPIELKIGNKTVSFEPSEQKKAFSV